jgi:hypothetical protein
MNSIGRFFLIASVTVVTGCRIDTSQPTAATAQADSSTPATAASVSVTSLNVVANSLGGETAIADNFDGTSGLEPEQGPAPVSIDPVGAFRMFCTAGQLLKDDPLFHPGQPGAAHLHQFIGNSGTNANSTYQSLRTSGNTSCGNAATPFNRSGYWFPAMLDGVGDAVKPDYLNLYYKRNPISDPMCSLTSAEHLGQCVDLPNGIRFVFGYNMDTGTNGITDPNNWEHWSIRYECWASEDGTVSNGTATGRYWTISDVAAAGCPVGARLMILADAPNCWDGVNLDTPDHRSHMAWGTGTYYVGQFFNACPADHPYMIPDMQMQISFTVDANLAKWHVSSDEMVPGAANGSTFHMDYWEAWSPTIKATWHADCINKHMSCSNGGLGDGTEIKGAGVPWGGWTKHQLVALSSIPGTTSSTTTVTTQVCPDGSVIPLTQTCPVSSPATKSSGGKALGRKK